MQKNRMARGNDKLLQMEHYIHSQSVRGASQGAQKKLFSSTTSSVERGNGKKAGKQFQHSLRLQR